MDISRRDLLQLTAVGGLSALARAPSSAVAQTPSPVSAAAIEPNDRVFVTNEDSNTIAVIDPRSNTVDTAWRWAKTHGRITSSSSRTRGAKWST